MSIKDIANNIINEKKSRKELFLLLVSGTASSLGLNQEQLIVVLKQIDSLRSLIAFPEAQEFLNDDPPKFYGSEREILKKAGLLPNT